MSSAPQESQTVRVTMPDQLRHDIASLIADRGLQPGDKLPTEAELSDLFGVGRSTAREALKSLEQEGLIYAVRGSGRFVSALGSLQVERPVTQYESISEVLEQQKLTVTSAVLDVQELPATPKQAAALAIEPGSPVIHLTRMRYGSDKPMVFSINTIPRALLPGPVAHRDWSTSITATLEFHGHRIVSAVTRISAVDLPEDVERRYSLGDLGPWLLTEEQCLTVTGKRVLYAEDYHRGSEIAFNVLRRR